MAVEKISPTLVPNGPAISGDVVAAAVNPSYRPPVTEIPARRPDRLWGQQQLNVNDRVTGPNGKTFLIMQGDGNLVLYRADNSVVLWASNTAGKPVSHAVMQNDGNFVCYDDAGHSYWSSGTNGHAGCTLILQDDGNLVLYGPNNVVMWASNTVCDWDPMTCVTGDQHVGTGEWMNTTASMAASGLVSGHTRIWCTKDLAGFHGSVFPVLLDGNGKAIWPADPQTVKHQYGVDGSMIFGSTSDRTVYWTAQADAATVAQARSLALIQFLDPKNMLLTDLQIVGQAVKDITAAVTAIAAA